MYPCNAMLLWYPLVLAKLFLQTGSKFLILVAISVPAFAIQDIGIRCQSLLLPNITALAKQASYSLQFDALICNALCTFVIWCQCQSAILA